MRHGFGILTFTLYLLDARPKLEVPCPVQATLFSQTRHLALVFVARCTGSGLVGPRGRSVARDL